MWVRAAWVAVRIVCGSDLSASGGAETPTTGLSVAHLVGAGRQGVVPLRAGEEVADRWEPRAKR